MRHALPFLTALVAASGLVLVSTPAAADPEECNGLDDDDDGFTDEELVGPPCSNSQTDDPDEGICEEGEEVCVDGEWICDANEPMPEVCDGKDNDCDGMTDEDLDIECPDGVCYDGDCLEPCDGDELLCPEGYVCEYVEGEFLCIQDVCNELHEEHLPCVDNPYCCDEGFTPPCHCEALPKLCADDCHGVTCPEGFTCIPEDGGTCHPLNEDCYHPDPGCPEGQHCVDQECVDDPCFGVTCADDEYCNFDGECVDPCVNMDCPEGWGCFEGECIEDPCAGVLCDPGLSCLDGGCIQADCWGVVCEFYEVCVEGECIHDPCWNIECPNCFVCIGGGCYAYEDLEEQDDPDTDSDDVPDTDPDTETDSDTGSDSGSTGASASPPIETRCGCRVVGQGSGRWLITLLIDSCFAKL